MSLACILVPNGETFRFHRVDRSSRIALVTYSHCTAIRYSPTWEAYSYSNKTDDYVHMFDSVPTQ